MAIKVIAQRREVKLGKNPGMKFAIEIAKLLRLGKKRNEFLLFCSQLFVTLQAKQERQWQNKMKYSGAQSYCWAIRRWSG